MASGRSSPVEITLDLAAARATSVVASMVRRSSPYEPEVVALLAHLFAPSSRGLFIDIGSHIGYFGLLLAKYAASTGTSLELIAHEPLPRLRRISRQLQRANDVHFPVHASALGDRAGEADFYVSDVSDASGSLVAGFRPSRDVIRVDVRTLDGLYLDALGRLDLDTLVLKIDVEMSEPAVLRGARGILERCRPFIVCEVLAGRTEDGIEDAIRDLAYARFRFDGASWRREEALAGDRTYSYRDWLLVPPERAAVLGHSFTVTDRVALRIRVT